MTSQLQILNKILQTKDYGIVENNNLTEDLFFNYRAEFNYIKTHVNKYHTVPDKLTFLAVFKDFDIIDVTEPDSYLLEQLFNDYNTSFLASTFNEIKQIVESGKPANVAIKMLSDKMSTLRTSSTMTCTDIFQDTSRFDRYLERVANRDKYYIPTGFDELDALIGGLDVENENMVIVARTGIGKSWTLLKMAAAAALHGKTVGIYSGEMAVDKVGYRIDTLIGHINNIVITRGTDTSAKLQYKDYVDNVNAIVPGTIKVLTPNDINGPATVGALRTFIERYHLDVLFIDQYSLLEDDSGAKTTNEKVANISKEVKNLQVMKRIPIVSVAQMNRTKTEDGEQDTTQIGLSDRVGQDATCVIMLSREITWADKEKTKIKDNRLILNIVKSRDGGTGKITYLADFNYGNFIPLDPSKEEDESQYSEEIRDYESLDAPVSSRPF